MFNVLEYKLTYHNKYDIITLIQKFARRTDLEETDYKDPDLLSKLPKTLPVK